ncbi:MAG: hypothetical protein JO314_07180 [Acidobacteria bacterium]|nr:hypothetical protein [Acidobacteriota bacterium]
MAYLPFFVFLLLAAAVIVGEALWLTRRGWTTAGRAWAFVLATDLIGVGFGGMLSFVLFFVMFMMVMGPSGQGGTSSEASYWVITVLAFLCPPVVLSLVKRIFIPLFRMPGGKRAWVFSLVAGFLVAAIIAIPPPVVYYLLSRYA